LTYPQYEPANAPGAKSRGNQDTCCPSWGPSRSAEDLPTDQSSHESGRAQTAGFGAPKSGALPNGAPRAVEVSDEGLDGDLGSEFWHAYADKIGLPKAGEMIEVSPPSPRLGVGIRAGSIRREAGEVSRSTRAIGGESRSLAASLPPAGGKMTALMITVRRGNRRDRATAARVSARRACAASALLVALIVLLAVVWPSRPLRLPVPTVAPAVPSAIAPSQPAASDLTAQWRHLEERMDAVERSRMHPSGQPRSLGVLLGIVAAGALGLLLMAGLALRYGLPPSRDADDGSGPGSTRRRIAARLGYGGVGACFALTTMLAAILAYQSRAFSVSTRPVDGAWMEQFRREAYAIGERVGGTEARVDFTESRVTATGASEQQASPYRGHADVRQPDHATTAMKLRRGTLSVRGQGAVVEGGRAPASTSLLTVIPETPAPSVSALTDPMPSPETEASSANAPAPSAQTESSPATKPSLADQPREDLKQVKREARSSADEIKKTFRQLRDWMIQKLPRDDRGREVIAGPPAFPHPTDR
jgi:hypothetical protein